MSRLYAIVILFSLSISHFYNSLLWLEFEAHQQYYAEEKCVLKDVEGNLCQGSCQIKAILQGDREEEPISQPSYLEESLILFEVSALEWRIPESYLGSRLNQYFEKLNIQSGILSGIWRPPRF